MTSLRHTDEILKIEKRGTIMIEKIRKELEHWHDITIEITITPIEQIISVSFEIPPGDITYFSTLEELYEYLK